MARMPLRFKLTLAFTGVMAVLLTGAGIALSVLVAQNLDYDDRRRARRARRRRRRGRRGEHRAAALASTGEPFAQVLDADGDVLRHDDRRGRGARCWTAASLAEARQGVVIVERRAQDGADAAAAGAARAAPTAPRRSLVVGEPLAQRERALGALHALLAIGGPLALLIASVVGYVLAAAALRPVERMRRHAAAVTAAGTSERLPVPPANDEIGRLGRTLNEMLARLEVAFKRERAFVSRRLARAAHAAGDPAHRARARAARRAHPARSSRTRCARPPRSPSGCRSLAEDLLVIARSDQGRLPVRPEPLEAGDVLARVAGRFQTRAQGRGPAAGRPIPSPGVELDADPARIEQALANLVDNALHLRRRARWR